MYDLSCVSKTFFILFMLQPMDPSLNLGDEIKLGPAVKYEPKEEISTISGNSTMDQIGTVCFPFKERKGRGARRPRGRPPLQRFVRTVFFLTQREYERRVSAINWKPMGKQAELNGRIGVVPFHVNWTSMQCKRSVIKNIQFLWEKNIRDLSR